MLPLLVLTLLVQLAAAANVPRAATGAALNPSKSTASMTPKDINIDLILENYWNSSMFLAQKTTSIPFLASAAATFPTATVNSTKTTPVIVGVEVHENQEFQKMMGIGAGITDATAIILQNLKETHPEAYTELLNLAFNPSKEWQLKGGAGMNMVRIPIGASDFGFTEYTYDDTYDGSDDPTLAQFNIEKSPKRWATLQDIKKIQPNLIIMATPWSQPGWMKGHQDGSLRGGFVLPQYEAVFGDYMVKFVKELDTKKGLKVNRISLQNEPLYDTAVYPCTKMEAPQQARIGALTRTKLDEAGYKDVGILAYDHNWDQSSYPVTVLDNAKKNSFVGAAWHCYGGDPTGQDPFNKAYPGKEVWFTECTRVTQFFEEPWINIKKQFTSLVGGSISHGSMSMILWNLALVVTEQGFTRPSLPKTCRNCLAPFLVFENATTPLQHMDSSMYQKLDSGMISSTTPAAQPQVIQRDLKKRATKETKAEKERKAKEEKDKKIKDKKATTEAPVPEKQVTTQSTLPEPNEGYNAMQIQPAGNPMALKSVNPAGELNEGAVNQNQVIPPAGDTFYRTSDFVTLAHLSLAIKPDTVQADWGVRVGSTTTEDNTEYPRVISQLFRRDIGNGSSRWSLILLQQNDDNGYNYGVFEDITIQIKFRESVATVVLPPGAFTLQWTAPNV